MIHESQLPAEEPEGPGLSDLIAILRRRIWYLILPALLIFFIVVAVAMLLPATFRSTATILIEQQQIPQDLVRTTVTGYADQRVQSISQRVMSTANLSELIEDYDLFRDERNQQSRQSLIELMREKIALEMIDAKVVDPRSGSAKNATIAFSLSFENESATKAQKVANELVSLFLNENLRKRQEAARETSTFLTAEANRLSETITELETKVASFKETHGDNLPDMQQVNVQFLARTEDQLERNALESRLLDERIVFLEAELARTPRYGNSDRDANARIITPKDRLMQLEMQYAELTTRLKPNHPDFLLLEREIATLRQQTGGLDVGNLEALLENARSALAERRKKWADSHPDVKSAQKTIVSLEGQLRAARATEGLRAGGRLPGNPAYLRIKAQLDEAKSERDFLRQQKVDLTDKLAAYEQRVKEAPKIEREFSELTRDYDHAVNKYREIKAKEMEAELAESLETERKAERFVLIEPPLVPADPIKPNRFAIVFLGAVLSLGGGIGATVLREMMSPGMYGSRAVIAVAGAPPMAVIPFIETKEEAAAKRRRKWLAIAAAILLLVGTITAVHLFVTPLDVAAYQMMQQMDLIQPGGGS